MTADVLPVLVELRPHLTAESLAAIYAEGHPQGLRFTAVYDEKNRCVAVAGWRQIATTVAYRKLYVDDLVTAPDQRGRGIGAALLRELEDRAGRAGCRVIDLDSGVSRADAHRFYFRQRMSITSLHFARRLDETPE
ncbi:MAG TPA: GNAT family N-acetyltransferase [Solirubrobacteraceae bacterium]|nr:GNAT family N-acetyltransferase [Solirubrobacteraceae bacterium]